MKKRTNLEISKSIVEVSRYFKVIKLDIEKLTPENIEIDKDIKEMMEMNYEQYSLKTITWLTRTFTKPWLLGIETNIKKGIQKLRVYRDNIEY